MSDHAEPSSHLVEIPDNDVTAVAKDFFLDGLVLPANVFLRIKAGHYILIGKKGAISAISTYHATAKADVKLYVRNSEYPNVASSNFSFTEKVVKTPQVNPGTKMRYINALSENVVNDMFTFGVGVGNVESLKRMGSFIQEVSANVEGIDEILASLQSLPNEMARHSMSTAFLSLLIAQEMNITLKAALEKIVLGALVHDIGLREIPAEILNKPRRSWSESDLQHYESHPIRGVEILKEIPQISNDILLIVNEHHENAMGLGFPRRIRDIKMNPLARIVGLADYVSDMMYGTPHNPAVKSLDEIVEHIENVLGQPFNKQVFLALKSMANKQNLVSKKA
jgi:putative nucleotidyltransferase with HDIG domain